MPDDERDILYWKDEGGVGPSWLIPYADRNRFGREAISGEQSFPWASRGDARLIAKDHGARFCEGLGEFMDAEVTVERYAEELVRLVAEERYEFPERFAEAKSWSDLHEVCDANEYLIEANRKLGIDFDFGGSADAYNRFANDAIALAEKTLFPPFTGNQRRDVGEVITDALAENFDDDPTETTRYVVQYLLGSIREREERVQATTAVLQVVARHLVELELPEGPTSLPSDRRIADRRVST